MILQRSMYVRLLNHVIEKLEKQFEAELGMPNYVEKNEETTVGFIGSSEMLDVSPQPVKFMIDDDRVSELHVKRGTVLISRSGTIGNMSFVNETLEKFLISEHAMSVRSATGN